MSRYLIVVGENSFLEVGGDMDQLHVGDSGDSRTTARSRVDYCCTVINVPACVVKPLYIATVGWSPLASELGTTTLN